MENLKAKADAVKLTTNESHLGKMLRRLEHFCEKGKLGDLGLFTLEKSSLSRDFQGVGQENGSRLFSMMPRDRTN